jgi:hypothetical protein
MKYAKKVYTNNGGGVTLHTPNAIWEAMGYPEYVEFVLNTDGTCKLVPRRLV